MKKLFGRKEVNSPPQMSPTLAPAYTIERYSAYYPMNHKHRGQAIIFAHTTFDENLELTNRDGNDVDCDMLVKSLQRLRFDVTLRKDYCMDCILKEIKRVSEMDHSDSDCLLVAVLSHGEEGEVIYAYDKPYQISSLWTFFTGDRCQTLVGKPKIFIIQACRGNDLASGVKVEKDGVARYSIPTNADFLFAFATFPGFMSFRNRITGSWFIRELCNELNENGQRFDMLTLLTFVTQKVAYGNESYNPVKPHLHMKKQTPCVVSMLTRLLLFNHV
nr:caspase-1-like [Aedes albopictus]XP_019559114.2 caspase-1-like [Aedes albopictus]XP_019559116.2 caspase-1-like [Aedes albopictus]XP_019559119.2 caspase-1-like [Aedes albopictus]XP_029728454.1 caspase-1-like [Aedes albopictus]XP_029728455.1 caspase-1-like [Aedes albopictus]XP_029728456.1 caspase-1-like [Aedes albopictus]XP_029728457.1 caspase-1-like [Aedes albopictus]XP_029728458.1 caspase-1-like [Aedes albopictus]XP_029728460.1 caspase-1-like [Aedes albopictus]